MHSNSGFDKGLIRSSEAKNENFFPTNFNEETNTIHLNQLFLETHGKLDAESN